MPTITTEVEVDVKLDSFDDSDLFEELESRGYVGLNDTATNKIELVTLIYEKRKLGNDYSQELDQLIYDVVGRM